MYVVGAIVRWEKMSSFSFASIPLMLLLLPPMSLE